MYCGLRETPSPSLRGGEVGGGTREQGTSKGSLSPASPSPPGSPQRCQHRTQGPCSRSRFLPVVQSRTVGKRIPQQTGLVAPGSTSANLHRVPVHLHSRWRLLLSRSP